MTERLRDEHEDVDIRRALPSTLVELAEVEVTDVMSVLLNILPHSDRRLHYQAIKALGKLRARFPETRFSKSEVGRLLKREAFELGALASLLDGVKSQMPALESHGLLVKILEERMEFTRERIFRLWGSSIRPTRSLARGIASRKANPRYAPRRSNICTTFSPLTIAHRCCLSSRPRAPPWSTKEAENFWARAGSLSLKR